jgi:hypothetical protein
MPKAERLHRWADILDLKARLQGAAPPAKEARCAVQIARAPLAVAFEDWAFRAEGLQSDHIEQALEFFGLSAGEMKRILSSGAGPQSLAGAAYRVRALAAEAEVALPTEAGLTVDRDVAGGAVRHATARPSAPIVSRRRNGAPAAVSRVREIRRRAADAGASARRRASS